ncbi:TRAP dicarboxylate transporter [Dinoroseobacter shibae DFL 12 = DSM 16493]|jgi:tripartite ATP-independent transporter DctM subunit|uniref:TRAP transporter large permease protein n=1 Tax=Dinoroseobacter shibae (strain DSM 16493 / NCIMB 14021 / DFL 12) TaxID=398580 RepID=A8LSG5_DINSH|nr:MULTISPECIES: TRAP transporter large permease subunit [Dinoroseobacter]ABV92779.1 TRAP dicarboxylate transporter [Dinoroseobacter shibae DFL 12 = DSM 16493]MDD9715879.1 TRAP transporter large permease subunit [Dinoroseobacter sp. PD6]URF47722.1 TRAP transporter large permease subunit [Dinoroseobacter shibae]URF52032.1 TRAP transporter large permease subunit [Dinoroseobacter shibae]
MDPDIISLILIGAMLAMLAAGIWVSLTLMIVGFLGIALFSNAPAGAIMATTIWAQSWSWALTALPLFIWMGEILFRTKLAANMFNGLVPWMNALPGRLLHVNVASCGLFAAVSGSSAATTATIGRITIPELEKRDYDQNMIVGSLAGSATLGFLIPPSIILIVYGVAAEVSISRLFIAGILPGLMLMVLFMGYIMLWSLMHPDRTPPAEPRIPYLERIKATAGLFPMLGLIFAVIGSIYAGLATPTEAAAVGVLGALLLSALSGTLNWASFRDSVAGATRTTCMITLILAGAAFLSVAMGFTGIPRNLAAWVGSFELSQFQLLLALTLLFVVMGCFLDGISIVVLTASVIMPMVQGAGIDLIWFGIYLVVVIEMSQITPPVGINLFILQSMTRHDLLTVAKMAFPFFLVLVLATLLLILFPGIATYLPSLMTRG